LLGKRLHWFGKEELKYRVVNIIDTEAIEEVGDFKEKVAFQIDKARKLKEYVNKEDAMRIDEIIGQMTQLGDKTSDENLELNKPYFRDLNNELLEIQAKYYSGDEPAVTEQVMEKETTEKESPPQENGEETIDK